MVFKDDEEEGEEEEESELKESIFDYEATDGKVVKKRRKMGAEYTRERNKPVDKINLIKGRAKAHSPSSNIKRKRSMLARDRKIKEATDNLDLSSDMVGVSLRYHKLNLNKEVPYLVWDIYSVDQDSIRISITADLHALPENQDLEMLIQSNLRDSKNFKKLLHSLRDFDRLNHQINKLQDIRSYHKTEDKNTVTYSFTINL